MYKKEELEAIEDKVFSIYTTKAAHRKATRKRIRYNKAKAKRKRMRR